MIRKINNDDLETIYNLGKKYDSNFPNLYNLESYVDNILYIMKCYEEDGIIKGFVIANALYESVEILLIYVDTLYRQHGIASKLLADLEKNSVENLLLEVSVQNEPALNLYKKHNYKIISTRKKYYNGIDAYVMRKELK
ncbi:MAG: GNAT family N-acetyltransferase [Bacilli bacterium]|nr:GNAT family N-acetyltransferase [Bacilli bacterium]